METNFDIDPIAEVVDLTKLTNYPKEDIPFEDKILEKYIISKGEGEIIKPTSQIKIRLVCRYINGELYKENNYQPNQLKKVKLSSTQLSSKLSPFLVSVVKTMRVGEISYLKKVEGIFTEQELFYRIHLESEKKIQVNKQKETSDTIKEKITKFQKLKAQGNEKFKEGKYKEALEIYLKGRILNNISKKIYQSLELKIKSNFDKIRIDISNNALKCFYKLKDYANGVKEAIRVKHILKSNKKFYVSYFNLLLKAKRGEEIMSIVKDTTELTKQDKPLSDEFVEYLKELGKKFSKIVIKETKLREKMENQTIRDNFQKSYANYDKLHGIQKVWERKINK